MFGIVPIFFLTNKNTITEIKIVIQDKKCGNARIELELFTSRGKSIVCRGIKNNKIMIANLSKLKEPSLSLLR